MRPRVSGLIALLVVAVSMRVHAQQTAPPQTTVVSLRETAAELIRSGAAAADARTVLAGAQLLITAERAAPGLRRLGDIRPDSARPEERRSKLAELNAPSALRLASQIAVDRGDAAVARAAAELASNADVGLGDASLGRELRAAADAISGTRGAIGGPLWADGNLAAGGLASFEIKFQGGHVPNRVDVSASNPRADLDCFLYEGDKLQVRDDGYGSSCSIRWDQRFTGTMTLRIRNTGQSTYFVLMSN